MRLFFKLFASFFFDFSRLDTTVFRLYNIMRIMLYLFLYYKSKPFNFSSVLFAGGNDINPGGVDITVSQNIC